MPKERTPIVQETNLTRKLSRYAYVPVLIFTAIVTAHKWTEIVEFWNTRFEGDGPAMAVLQCIVLFFAIVWVNSVVTDRLLPIDHAKFEKETPEQKRQAADLAAKAAVKDGNPHKALAIYENAGMFVQAMELADSLGNREAQARLWGRMGKFDKAFRIWNDVGNHEEAARCATLGKDNTRARESYRRAAEAAEKRGAKAAELAGLWDRAGEYAKAAPLYEKAGDLFRAAECFELSRDLQKAAKMKEQGNVIKAYERSKGGAEEGSPEHIEALIKAADLEMKVGDYLAAAIHYREAGQFKRAGEVFEEYGEYERAASAYESGGLAEQATSMRQKSLESRPPIQMTSRSGVFPLPTGAPSSAQVPLPPGPIPTARGAEPPLPPPVSRQVKLPTAPPPQVVRNAPPPLTPAPAAAPRISSQSIQRMPIPAAPVPLSAGGGARGFAAPPAPMPLGPHPQAMPTPVTQYVPVYVMAAPDGKILTATSQADIDWVARAVHSEKAGEFQNAADLYRQIGQFDRAGACLANAGRPAEAALFNVAIGRSERAVRLLTDELEKHSDPELGELLGELYIERGHYFKAMELLCRKLAPEGISQSNADLFYRFAQKFEDAGALKDALYLYRELIASGALSEDVTERVKRIERSLGPQAPPEHKLELQRRKSAADYLKSIIDTSSSSAQEPAEPIQPSLARGTAKPFPFVPRSLPKPIMRDGTAVRETFAPKRGLSLLAPPDQADEHTAATSVLGRALGEAPRASSPYAPATRYNIKREIARGGMGVVYEATDTALGRDVALKLLQNTDADTEELQQFLMEARAIARLNHTNVVAIYDIGLMDLRHYIAMEMVKGSNLRELVVRSKKLALHDALRFLHEIALGLQAAHEAGIVHRDIKPANILLTEKEAVKIADFGLAKLARHEEADAGEKTMFKTAGTPGYMAPEQIEGGEIGPAADIYPLGVTLFFMLSGHTPAGFAGKKNRNEIFEMQLSGALPTLKEACPDVPDAVEQIYRYCTARNPAERYGSVAQFLPTLEKWRAKLAAK